jgi:organic hydroperoxide reductase OsmC/OhrA
MTWTGKRSGTLTSEGKPPIHVSSPAGSEGQQALWSPEEMFVASVEACHMVTFLSLAARNGLQIVAYTSHSNGVIEFVNGDHRLTRVVIFPTITVPRDAAEAAVLSLLREAREHCLVANSIDSIVEFNPTIIHH